MGKNAAKKMIFTIGAVFLAMLIVCGFMMFSEGSTRYIRVGSACMEEQSGERDGVIDFTGGMKYLYTQPAYDDKGNAKDVTFGSNKVLREGAYLKLTLSPVRGVTDWEEVSFEDMPDKVREKFSGQKTDNSDSKERSAAVVVSVESDNIYGVIFEYSVDRTRLGGQSISKNPDMTAPLPREKSYVKFSEKGFRTPEELENGTFGIMIEVILENGEEVPVEYLYEWNAEYGKEYNFTLSGDRNNGFAFEPTDKDIEYEITPWSELPIKFLQ